MISRRNFLKYSGLAALAAGAGYSSGKLSASLTEEYFIIQGFLPDDEKIIKQVFISVNKNVRSGVEPVIIASGCNAEAIKNIASSSFIKEGSEKITIRMNRLDKPVASDILISDGRNYIYSPETDHTVLMNKVREQLKGRSADLFFSIECRKSGFLTALLGAENKNIVILNQNGIAEKISAEKEYNNITVAGSIGNTAVEIKNGMVRVKDSCCKNKICAHSGYITNSGNIIACAPNKVLVRIENS